jgi:peptidoglycan/xylan/chitin deacetylase (PgdA/CDA1 family)
MKVRFTVSIAVLVLLFNINAAGFGPTGGIGEVSVKKWADDRKSAFTFTYDDGYITQYQYVKPILDSFGFKATFFIISGSMTDDLPGIWRYGTWKQFNEMALEGHEIGSHTVTHPELDTLKIGDVRTPKTMLYELAQSQITIEQKITNQKCISLAYPYFIYSTLVKNETALYYESGRGGGGIQIDASLADTAYYSIGSKEEQFSSPRNSISDDLDELQNFQRYEDSSITLGKWGMLVGHEVYPFAQITDSLISVSWFPQSTEWLTSLCGWLKEKSDSSEIWVETMGNVIRYMKERDHFNYSITLATDTQIQINATDSLSGEIYNYPLTVDITVPADWEWAYVIQGSKTDSAKVIIAGNSAYIRTKIIPDGGNIILNKRLNPTGIAGTNAAPKNYSLEQNYPNPFNPSTRIQYYIPFESNVRVTVFNALGETVRELANEIQRAGNYELSFNSAGLSSGVYFYSIAANSSDGKQSFRETRKMVLIK